LFFRVFSLVYLLFYANPKFLACLTINILPKAPNCHLKRFFLVLALEPKLKNITFMGIPVSHSGILSDSRCPFATNSTIFPFSSLWQRRIKQ
jgi:hypothetical protein